MKTTFQTKRAKKRWINSPSKLVVLVLGLIIFFLIFFGFLQNFFSNISLPFFKLGNSFYKNLNITPKFFSDKNKLIQENQELLNQINDNDLLSANYEAVIIENKKLRSELGLKPAKSFVTASIVSRAPQMPTDLLMLDRGEKDGVKPGDFVLAGERILIGKVDRVFSESSILALNSYVNTITHGFVSQTNDEVEIQGSGNGSMETKLPIDFNIKEDDKIMMYGSFNYLFAKVQAIEEDKSSGFKNILMSLPINLSQIDTVFILHNVSE